MSSVSFLESGSESADDFRALFGGRLFLLLRRHFSEVELIQNSLPGFESWQVGEIILQKIETIVPLLFVGAVTFDAVFLQEGSESVQRWIGFAKSEQIC